MAAKLLDAKHGILSADPLGLQIGARSDVLAPISPIALRNPIALTPVVKTPVAVLPAHPGPITIQDGEHPQPVIGDTGTTAPIVSVTLESSSATGVLGNGDSTAALLNAAGTNAAFESTATKLNADLLTPDTAQIFVKNVLSGAITLASTDSTGHVSNAASTLGGFSANGTFLGFTSAGSNLVAGDTNGVSDVFLHNLATGATTLVSSATDGTIGNGASVFGSFNPAGTLVAFTSTASNLGAANLTASDSNGTGDLFLKDLTHGEVTLHSISAAGVQQNGTMTSGGWFSPNGAFVAFISDATNLVPGFDPGGVPQLYVKDLGTGAVHLVSSSFNGGLPGAAANAASSFAGWSSDGNEVLFTSAATNLVAGDTNGATDVFIKNIANDLVTLVSTNASGTAGDGASTDAHWSPDGGKITFTSAADNLVAGDTNGTPDVFVKDLNTGTVTLASQTPQGTQGDAASGPGVSSNNGATILFSSDANNFTSSDTNASSDVFLAKLGYVAHGAAVELAGDITVGSLSGHLISATVAISAGFQAGDILTADTTGTSITAVYNATTHTMTLTGTDSDANYQEVMRSIE